MRLCRHIGVLRFAGPLPLSNQRAIQSEFIRWAKTRSTVQTVVFLGHALGELDASEARNLQVLVEAVREAGYRVLFAEFSDQNLESLARKGVADAMGVDNIFTVARRAISAVFFPDHADESEPDCPLQGALPRLIELSLHPDGSMRDARRRGLPLCQRIVAVRFDGALDFSTIDYFEQELRRALERRPSARHILLAAHSLEKVDSVAAEELPRILEAFRGEGYEVAISGIKDDSLETLQRVDRAGTFGANTVYPTQAKAIEAIYSVAHRGSTETACPLLAMTSAGGGGPETGGP